MIVEFLTLYNVLPFITREVLFISRLLNIDPSLLDTLSNFKFHFMIALSAKSSIKELKILHKIAISGVVSSYRLSQDLGIPSATTWRLLKKLCKEGYTHREDKGFSITPKGLFILYRSTRDEKIKKIVIKKLKDIWNYEGEVEDISHIFDDIIKLMDNNKIEIKNVCFNYPASVAGFLLPFSTELSDGTKKVIAYYITKTFPTVAITPFCKAVVSFDERGIPYGIAVNCRKDGLKLNHYCETIQKIFLKKDLTELE